MATKGTAWLFRRSRDLVPALTALAVREWRAGDDEWRTAGDEWRVDNYSERDISPEGAPT
jgi:hypothetical protein